MKIVLMDTNTGEHVTVAVGEEGAKLYDQIKGDLTFHDKGSDDYEKLIKKAMDKGIIPAENMKRIYADAVNKTTVGLNVPKVNTIFHDGSTYITPVLWRNPEELRQGLSDIAGVIIKEQK